MEPLTVPDAATGDVETHLECCRIDVALCGERLQGEYVDVVPDDACEVCLNMDRLNGSCGALFCRRRQWWRSR